MDISHIDLRHLRYFIAVAEELHFSRAAARLHMSQPPLSQKIQELEARLDTTLFVRTKRKVSMTRAAQHLLPLAKKTIRSLEEALHGACAVGQGYEGDVRIGTMLSAPLVPAFGRALHAFHKHYPTTRMVFHEMRQMQLMKELKRGELDIVFMWHILSRIPKNQRLCLLSDEPLHFTVSQDHPLAKKKQLTISDLETETLFLSSMQVKMDVFAELENMAHRAHVSLRISEESLHFPVIANLIGAGAGVGLLPPSIAQLATRALVPLKMRGLSPALTHLQLAAVSLRNRESPQTTAFMDLLESKKRT